MTNDTDINPSWAAGWNYAIDADSFSWDDVTAASSTADDPAQFAAGVADCMAEIDRTGATPNHY